MTVTAILLSASLMLRGLKHFGDDPGLYTNYNNYVIFKLSFKHLISGENLYSWYPKEQWDIFKYSPTFALLMAPFFFLPDWLGLTIWNLLNILVFFYAFWRMPFPNERKKLFAIGFVFVELTTSILNAQTNALIGGLLIFAFLLLENKQLLLATLLITIATYIKIFGAVAFLLIILYPGRWRAALYAGFWMILLGLMPLAAMPSGVYHSQLLNWISMLQKDHSESFGFSVMGWLHSWFAFEPDKKMIVLTGILLLCLPLLRIHLYGQRWFRLLMLNSILIWVIIFNHKAESATFIIAVIGIAIWYFNKATPSLLDTCLMIGALIFTVLSPTDIFPRYLREHFIAPYALKGFPCILIWCKILWEQLFPTFRRSEAEENYISTYAKTIVEETT